MRGSSGANIALTETMALKRGDKRVVEQGLWLMAHCKGTGALPEIVSVEKDGYIMERLEVPNLADINCHLGYSKLLFSLEEVWATPKATQWKHQSFDLAAHLKRMEPLIPASRISGWEMTSILSTLGTINWLALARANTHGDPIIDNVLLRDEQYVLIDPIPSTPAIPDVMASDLGRVFQSVLGYEKYRYGLDYPLLDPVEWLNIHVSDRIGSGQPSRVEANEVLAVVYWAVFHLMRSTVYVTNKVAMDIYENCIVPGVELMDRCRDAYDNACLEDRGTAS